MEEKGRKSERQWYFSSTAGAGEREAPSTVLTQVASRSSPLVLTTSGHGGLTSHCLHLYFIACWHSGPFQGHHTPGAAFKHRLMGVGVQIPQLPCPWGRKTQGCVPRHLPAVPWSQASVTHSGNMLGNTSCVSCLPSCLPSPLYSILPDLPSKFQLRKS